MNIEKISIEGDIPEIVKVIEKSFSETPDSHIDDWFSIVEMISSIKNERGVCLKATEDKSIIGMVHAQWENPINGREGREKWVITNLCVLPSSTAKGVGSSLLESLESEIKQKNAKKIFVHTNKEDEKVIHFYQKNGYSVVGTIQDYYYEGSAIFLIKHL